MTFLRESPSPSNLAQFLVRWILFYFKTGVQIRCAEDGGIEALVALSRQTEEQLQALALASLRHLSLEPVLKVRILQARVMRTAVRCVSGSSEDIHLQCAGAYSTQYTTVH